MKKLSFVPISEIRRARKSMDESVAEVRTLSDIFRINALYMIMRAGSGHIGTTFSAIDIMTWLWTKEMVAPNDKRANPSDVFFSSKGHDSPALYSILAGLGKIDFELIHTFRKLGGLPGHPDIGTPYVVTNTGSLGMGISKARGMAAAKRLSGKSGRVYVLAGDGELQEGQIWESAQPTANRKYSEITLIVDHNKIQSDSYVVDTSDLGQIADKFRSFGWEVVRCDGHDVRQFQDAIAKCKSEKGKPQVIIADTVKGKGVSFMEAIAPDSLYKFHSGAPSYKQYVGALGELTKRVNAQLKIAGAAPLTLTDVELPKRLQQDDTENLIKAYGDELVLLGRTRGDIVAIDADLVVDTGLLSFKKEFPDRYVECGIAEQDMVSFAGGLALAGYLPIVHSFACFLSTRPNEQIYNNASEKTKIIYTGSLSGLLPAAPGHSHQSVRDISTLGSIPGLTLIEPANEEETRLALSFAVSENEKSTYIRLVSIPCEVPFSLPDGYTLKKGRGVRIVDGKDAALISYGPVMLSEAVRASRLLQKSGIKIAVYNLPWLNTIDEKWLSKEFSGYKTIFTLDDHYVSFGQGSLIVASFAACGGNTPKIISLGVSNFPECGDGEEVLLHHRLDSHSIARLVKKYVQ